MGTNEREIKIKNHGKGIIEKTRAGKKGNTRRKNEALERLRDII